MDGCGDGSWNGEQYFSCRDGHAMFIVLSKLKPDSRFVQQPQGDNRKVMCVCVYQLLVFFGAGLWYMLLRDWENADIECKICNIGSTMESLEYV